MKFYDGDRVLSRTEAMEIAIEVWGNECYLCKEPPTKFKPLNLDHWYPIAGAKARGWREVEYNAIENIRPAHHDCNRIKNDQWPYPGWVFKIPAKAIRAKKVEKVPPCQLCAGGRWIDALNGVCPMCGIDNAKRKYPASGVRAVKDCTHIHPHSCFACVVLDTPRVMG